ncbi:NAD-dependent deacetylase sirtuin-2 [Phlegmacium glaucopus]|nr:NAD-dependent deacetylase sirtuin-2 [Phlegmacium glaucopus]
MNFLKNRRSQHSKEPKILKGKDIPSLAQYIKSKECENVILLLGAGVSTSAGIPDFRSPETGLYSNLARLNLPHPEAVFEIGFFRRNPVPFYTLAHELYPGKFRPTITHSFIRLLAEKSLLHTCFTQNIDTLERRAGVPDDKVIEAHGSFATQRCIDCKRLYDDEKMKEHIEAKKIAKCEVCGGYVKPDIVFFGEGLPPEFINSVPSMRSADLLIVMGTSLTVRPFASLAGMVGDSCPRVLINLDHVGDFGSRADDVILLGKCDETVRELCKELGWENELLRLWEETEASVLKSTDDELEDTVPAETARKPQEPDHLKDVTAKMAQLVVESAEKEGVSDTSASKPSESKVASTQAESPENLKEAPTEKASSSDLPDNNVIDATPTNEQKVGSKETKSSGDTESPRADKNLKL